MMFNNHFNWLSILVFYCNSPSSPSHLSKLLSVKVFCTTLHYCGRTEELNKKVFRQKMSKDVNNHKRRPHEQRNPEFSRSRHTKWEVTRGRLWLMFPYFVLGGCCYSVTTLCLTLYDPMGCSTQASLSPSPGVCWTHVHWVGDVIQPSHPLSPTSPPALNLTQHQDLFQ